MYPASNLQHLSFIPPSCPQPDAGRTTVPGREAGAGNPTSSDLVREAPRAKSKPQALPRRTPEVGVSVGSGIGRTTINNGATRAAKYSLEWGDASLNEAINRFAPNVEPASTSKGKIVYNNPETGISVVYDKNGNYFRIEDTTRPRGRNYLDINGNDMNNEIVNGKTRGRSRADYQRVTHFNNSDEQGELYGKE